MSMRLLGDPRAVHEVCDDVESAIWLLLWLIAKFGPHEMMPGDTHSFLEVFDPNPANPHDRKQAFAHYGRLRIKHLALRIPALESLLNELVDVLPKDIDTPSELLRDHTWLINRLKSALENEALLGMQSGTPRHARIFDKMDIINVITNTYSCSIKAVDTRYGNTIYSTGFHCARFQ